MPGGAGGGRRGQTVTARARTGGISLTSDEDSSQSIKKNKGILYFKKYFSSVFSAPSNSSPQPVEEEELSTDVEDDEEDEEQGDARRTASVPDGKSADGSDEERRSVHLVDDRATAGTSRSVEAECTTAIELG